MSDKTLKEELLKDGIEIKSNKKGLLKDMYMFFIRWVVLKYTKNNLIIIFYLTCFILAILLSADDLKDVITIIYKKRCSKNTGNITRYKFLISLFCISVLFYSQRNIFSRKKLLVTTFTLNT